MFAKAQVIVQETTPATLPALVPGLSEVTSINSKSITYNYTLPPPEPTPVDGDTTTEGNGALYYGDAITFGAQMSDGNYTTTSLGKAWTLKIVAHNAKDVGLIFGTFSLSDSAEMYIYNGSETELDGPIKAAYFSDLNDVALGPLSDSIVFIYILEHNNFGSFQSTITIPKLLAGFVDFATSSDTNSMSLALPPIVRPFGATVNCDPSISCYPYNAGIFANSAESVAVFNCNGLLCTGTLLNDEVSDGRPFFLTAFHCLDKNENGELDVDEISALNSAVFQFQYWRTTCNSATINEIRFSGATLRAAWHNSDFLLLELKNPPGIGDIVTYSGWNRQTSAPEDVGSYILHFPQGADMRITLTKNVHSYLFNGKFWQAYYSTGTTDRGSSGSALFNAEGQVTGQLKGGWSSCDFTDFSDRYGKFSSSWSGGGNSTNRLEDWLSPSNDLVSVNSLILSALAIDGPDVLQCDDGTFTFSVPNLTGCSYSWTVTNNINIVSGQGTSSLVVAPISVDVSQGGIIQVTITDSKGINRTVTVNKSVTLGAPFYEKIGYVVHAGCGAYIFTYDGSTSAFDPPIKYFEAQSLNGVQIQPYPPSYPGTGLPPSGPYDQYGGGITVPSGTAQVKIRYKNECGWSDWTQPVMLSSCSPYVIYPSPAAKTITIATNSNASGKVALVASNALIQAINIIDESGKILIKKRYPSQTDNATINISKLVAGTYIVNIFNGNQWTALKFVKQ